MAAVPSPRRFDVDEYYKMGETGILAADDRVELIEGEIIEMPPIGSRHASCVKRLIALFAAGTQGAAVVSAQDPVRLSRRSEPVPDLLLLRPRPDFYASAHPTVADVLLLVEVSDSTLAFDQRTKVPLYAQEGISEVWIVDVAADRILVYREPSPDGYRVTSVVPRGAHLAPIAFPSLDLSVEDIVG